MSSSTCHRRRARRRPLVALLALFAVLQVGCIEKLAGAFKGAAGALDGIGRVARPVMSAVRAFRSGDIFEGVMSIGDASRETLGLASEAAEGLGKFLDSKPISVLETFDLHNLNERLGAQAREQVQKIASRTQGAQIWSSIAGNPVGPGIESKITLRPWNEVVRRIPEPVPQLLQLSPPP